MNREPKVLRQGKVFHKRVQKDWKLTAKGGRINIEKVLEIVQQGKAKKGRMDILVDEVGDFVSIVEIKSTSWDKIKEENILKLLASHRRQIWKYINHFTGKHHIDVCPGIIYSRIPKSQKLRSQVENYLNDYGIQVVWYRGE